MDLKVCLNNLNELVKGDGEIYSVKYSLVREACVFLRYASMCD